MVALKRAPSSATDFSTIAETMKEISTPRMVMTCEPRRPTVLPNRPAMMEPTSGASGTVSSRFWESCADIFFSSSTLQGIELVHRDGGAVAEEHDQDRQADGRLGGRHREDEEHEDLAVHVAQVV